MSTTSTTKHLPLPAPADRASGAACDAGRVGVSPVPRKSASSKTTRKARISRIPDIEIIRAAEGKLAASIAAALLKRNLSLLTSGVVADRAGISLTTLQRRRKAGFIHPVPLGCDCVRFAESLALSDFIQQERERVKL